MRPLPLVILLALIASGCAKGGVVESGSTLTLPPKHPLAEYIQSQRSLGSRPNEIRPKLDMVFHKWDGQYPSGWPKAIELPAGVYTFYGASLDTALPGDDPGIPPRKCYALVKAKPDEMIAHFRQQMQAAGFHMDNDESLDLPKGRGFSMHRLCGEPPGSTSYLQVWVYKTGSPNGYTFLEMDWNSF